MQTSKTPTKKYLNILFLGGGKRVSMGKYFVELGRRRADRKVRLFSYELTNDVPIRSIANIVCGKKWSDCESHLTEVILSKNIDIVIPFVDPATIIAAKLVAENVPVFAPVSNLSTCDQFFSKISTNSWCILNNIPVPSTTTSSFPLIAKPDKGSASRGIHILNTEGELSSIAKDGSYLIQKYIRANEYTVDIYRSINHGNINYLVPRIRLETQGGEAIKARTVFHPAIDQLSRIIIEKSGLSGAITLQFLEDTDSGEVFFMEANPRFGGGVVTAYGAGIDIAATVLSDFDGRMLEENKAWESGLLMLRQFRETYIHANNH